MGSFRDGVRAQWTWARLDGGTRAEVLRLAAVGRTHPDPAVAGAAIRAARWLLGSPWPFAAMFAVTVMPSAGVAVLVAILLARVLGVESGVVLAPAAGSVVVPASLFLLAWRRNAELVERAYRDG